MHLTFIHSIQERKKWPDSTFEKEFAITFLKKWGSAKENDKR